MSAPDAAGPQARRLLIVWWSATGATRQLAEAAAAAAHAEPGIATASLRADLAGSQDVLAADAYLFAAPENLATMAGIMKDFFDRTYYDALGRIEGRAFAVMIAAGSDGQGAARQLARIAQGWRLRAVAEPLIVCTHAQTPERIRAIKQVAPADLERAAELGAVLAAGLAAGIW